ncbi:M1 family metallopeptidase [Gemmatimonadota bacterium]
MVGNRTSVSVLLLLAPFSVALLPASRAVAQENIVLNRPVPGPVVPPPYFRAALERGTRGPDGRPGPNYWQVYSEYDIDARLDPASGLLSGHETIRFHNRSPDALPVLFLFLHQNIHAEGVARARPSEVTGGVRLERIKTSGQELLPSRGMAFPGGGGDPGGRRAPQPGYQVVGQIMLVRLPEAVAPGQTVDLDIEWSFVVPQNGAGRMGHSDREMYFLAYWFPKIAVFDDLRGWDAEPYLGAEMYEGYGDYRVSLTVPNGWTVMATGDLVNAEEVLSGRTRQLMDVALQADTMVQIVTREDREAARVTTTPASGTLTYRFEAENVRDFTWTTSNLQLWTGTSALVPDRDGDGADDRVAIHAFWRDYRAPLWEDQALYGKHSIEFESRFTGFSYPWPHMTSVEGADIIGGGMEFPMFTLIGSYEGGSAEPLYGVTAHELAHMWIPMIVGANEKRHAWIDEGSTTFLENQAKPDYWPNAVNGDSLDMEGYLMVARMEMEQSMMRHGDYYEPGPGYGTASYPKPASLLVTLRNYLGEDAFMEAYQGFIRDWAFKHPSPWDFFNAFERVAGHDLDWFWSSFYYETWALDHAVASVETEGDETVITVADQGFATMPARLRIETTQGGTLEREVPVSRWLTGAVTAEVRVPASAGSVTRVEIDPDRHLPDLDRSNNVWEVR